MHTCKVEQTKPALFRETVNRTASENDVAKGIIDLLGEEGTLFHSIHGRNKRLYLVKSGEKRKEA